MSPTYAIAMFLLALLGGYLIGRNESRDKQQ